MPNQMQIGLSFTADTSKARQEIEKLKNDLTKVMTNTNFGKGNNDIINQTAKLSGILAEATKETGKLDLTKFQRGLSKANIDLNAMAREFQKIDGGDFFNNLATQVMNADTRVTVLSGKLKKFANGLMNTAMWTIQSNAIHAVESALNSAYSYAQRLNKGLTDIAIVSELNTQQLTEFAKTANQMAKDLSASTSEVVSGALIYYQAGLSDEEVLKRTETTIKLAQTSGESAEQISSYMTAIWNNFYDGSKSIEYYADAISYLGAVTAASNADIAEGMQAFAATADTVGLSFEYGAAALTTLRDITQQSASTIGNSLKTIFARLSSVSQGETLEDGVDLTKYSKALQTVGVEILDANGQLKNMDTILDDLADKWQNLDEANKVALATTVGGVRQYNNLISLMDNYERFQELVAGSYSSEGYLQNQADIYAKSWEGAKNRLQAAWEGIYDQIIDDKFFIKLTNFLTWLINTLGEVIKGMGGIPGVISAITMAITSINPDGIASSLRNIADTILLIKNTLSGLQADNNLKAVQAVVDATLGANVISDDNAVFKFYDDAKNKIQEIAQLRADGKEAQAAELATQTERYLKYIDLLAKTAAQQEALNAEIENLAAVADISDKKLLEMYENVDALTLAKLGGKVQNKGQAKTLLAQLQNAGYDSDHFLVQNLNNYINDKALGGGHNTRYQKQLQEDAQQIAADIQNEINKALDASDNKVEFDKLLDLSKKDYNGLVQAIKNEYADLIKNGDEASASAENFLKRLLAFSEGKPELEKLNQELKQMQENLNGVAETAQATKHDFATSINSGLKTLSSLTMISSSTSSFVNSLLSGNASFASIATSLFSIFRNSQFASENIATFGTELIKAGAAGGAFSNTLNTVGSFLTALPGWVGPVVAVTLPLLIKGFQKLIELDYKESPLGQLDQANDNLETSQKLLQQTNSELENTLSIIENLHDNQDSFQNLVKGTSEWTQAVIDNNNAVLELLDSYDMLRSENYTKDINGILSLTDEAEQNIETLARLRVNSAQAGILSARNLVDEAKLNLSRANYEDLFNQAKRDYDTVTGGDTTTPDLDQLIASIQDGTLVLSQTSDGNVEIIGELDEAVKQIIQLNPPLIDALNKVAVESASLKEAIALRNQQMGQNLVEQLKAEGFNIEPYQEEQFSEKLGEEFNKAYSENLIRLQKLQDGQIANKYQDTLNNLGLRYDRNKDTWYDSAGNERNTEQVRIALANTLATQIVKVQAVNGDISPTVDSTAQAEWEANAAKQAEADKEAFRLQGAREDVNNNANGFSKKDLGSIQSLVEELKTGTLYAERFSEKTLETEGSVQKLAFAMKQADQGIEEWTKNWYGWRDAIENGDNDMWSAIEAMDEIKESSADLLGITDELSGAGMTLGATFGEYVTENLDTVYEAFSGSQEAALEMQKWAAEDIAAQLQSAKGLTDEQLANVQDSIAAHMDVMAMMLDSGDLKFGRVDDTELLSSLENIINSIATSKEQAEAILAGMGYDAEVEEETKTTRRVGMVWEPAEYQPSSVMPVGINGTDNFTFPQLIQGTGTWKPVEVDEPMQVTALKIKTADYVGGGNITTSKGGGGARAPKKSGGGGGSKKKTKEKDTTRYHEITSRIEQNQHALNMLNAQEDRAYGQKKLDMMDQKLKLLEQQAELYKELAKEAQAYYDADREKLHNEYGAAFNADGSIKDYDAWYGHFIDLYNAGRMSDDEWTAFDKAIKNYEDSLKKLNDTEEKAQKNAFEQYDLKLEKVEYKLKTITDLLEMDMKYLDYLINMLDDDGLDTAEAIGYLANEIDDITQKYNANRDALEGIFKNHENITDQTIQDLYNGTITVEQFIDAVGDFTEKEISSIQSIISDMFTNGKDLKKYIEDLYGELDELSDKFQEALDKQIDKLDHMNNMIEQTRNIIDIMGKDTLGISDELLNRMQRAQIEIGKEHVATLQQELAQYRLWLAQEQALYDTMDPESLEARALRDVIENYQKMITSLEEEILDTTADTAEKIKQIYRDMIEQTIKNAGDIIAGAVGDFDKLMDVYEKQNNLNDRYLDTYEKTYQTNKLLMDINKALDSTDNIGTQEKLRDLQEEILGYQQDGLEVTEQQMEERRLYYELLLAEAALQEAQDAKSQVRMTRDSEGNWSYVYTADQGRIDDVKQKYNDALHAYEEFNESTLKTMQDTLLQLQQEYSDALAEAQTEDEVRAIQQYYGPMIEHQGQMIDYFIARNNELVDNFNVDANQVSTTLDDTVYGMVTGFDNIDTAIQTTQDTMNQAAEEVIDCIKRMDEEQQALATSVGVTEPQINEDLDKIEQGVKDVNTEVDKVSDEFNEEFNDAMGTLENFHNKLGPIVDAIIGEMSNITSKVEDVITAYSQLNATPITTPDLSGPIGSFRALEAAANAAAAAAKRAANAGKDGGGGDESRSGHVNESYSAVGSTNKGVGIAPTQWNYKFATGGYTGAWGNDGKWAVLHEKELVLNKTDTQNLLTTVGFVRDLTRMISLNAAEASSGLSGIFNNGAVQGGGYLDQNVTIHAEFPNAVNHSEIEEAFGNLIGLATQYAGRKK